MKDELVSFETAKLAKEKGFNITSKLIGSHHYFYKEDGSRIMGDSWGKKYYYLAPTQALLQKWLRELPTPIIVKPSTDMVAWEVEVYHPDKGLLRITKNKEEKWLNSYEEALEHGLQEALKLV